METMIIHHRDADGFCAAAIAKMAGIEGRPFAVQYGEEWPCILPGSVVYMLDFSLQPFEQMEALNQDCELYWIDHHKSALSAAAAVGFVASGGQSTTIGLAACELTWTYFNPTKPMPLWVELTGRFDVWDHSDSRTLPFHYGLMSYDLSVDTKTTSIWEKLSESSLDMGHKILSDGSAIQSYVKIKNASQAKEISFDLSFEGLRFIAFNRAGKGSMIADSVWDPEVYDAIIAFGWTRDHWVVGLYSDKLGIDVSTIAVKYGGGGHRGAAGFQCQELPFALGE